MGWQVWTMGWLRGGEPAPGAPRRRWSCWGIALVLLTLAAFALRLAYLQETVIEAPIRADAREYVVYAHNLLQYGTFSKDFRSSDPQPDSYRAPGYPFAITLAFLLGGDKGYYPIVRNSQAVLSALLVPLTFLLGVRFLPRKAAMAAAGLVALSPHLVSLSSYILTETLFAFCLLASFTLFFAALERDRIWLFIAAGVCCGYAYLVNHAALPLAAGLAAITWVRARGRGLGGGQPRRALLVRLGIFVLVASLAWAGWAMRCRLNVPPGDLTSSRRALATITHGSYPGFVYRSEKYKYHAEKEDPEQPAYAASLENFRRIFWERFKQRPLRHLTWYLLEKPYYLWSWNILEGQGDIYVYLVTRSLYTAYWPADLTRLFMKALHPVLVLAALGGVVLLIRRRGRAPAELLPDDGGRIGHGDVPLHLAATLIYFTITYGIIFHPMPRYAVPLRPELYLLATWAVVAVMRAVRLTPADP